MKTYEKTPNLFARYKEKPLIGKYDSSQLMLPSFEKVDPLKWSFFEKIDGMNIRIILRRDSETGGLSVLVKGRSDKANIPGDLLDTIHEMATNRSEPLEALVGDDVTAGITLYGEGYGPGIQKGGGDYRQDKGFVLFDIARWINDGETQYYLLREDVEDIAENCRLTVAPQVFAGKSLEYAVRETRKGFLSRLANFKGGYRQAEGIIGQAEGLFHFFNGSLKRLKFKLKTKDFPS
jgi:hypothetical protein